TAAVRRRRRGRTAICREISILIVAPVYNYRGYPAHSNPGLLTPDACSPHRQSLSPFWPASVLPPVSVRLLALTPLRVYPTRAQTTGYPAHAAKPPPPAAEPEPVRPWPP